MWSPSHLFMNSPTHHVRCALFHCFIAFFALDTMKWILKQIYVFPHKIIFLNSSFSFLIEVINISARVTSPKTRKDFICLF